MQNNGFDSPETLEDCPSDSEFAALLDGTLEPKRAEEVGGHVLDCASCREVYGDALRFEIELPIEPPVAPPIKPENQILAPPPPPRARERQPRRPLQTSVRWAAGLVAASLSAYVIWPVLNPSRPESFTAEDTVKLGLTSEALRVLAKDGGAFREEREDTRETLQARLHIGARLFDLGVAVANREHQPADRCLSSLMQSSKLLGTEKAKESWTALAEVREDLRNRPALEPDLAKRILETAESLREKEPGHGRDYQDFGHWTEAGYLAAGSREGAFFSATKSREFLDWLQKERGKGDLPIELTAAGLEQLDKIASSWPDKEDAKPPYETLETAFKQLQKDADDAVGTPASF